MSKDILKEYISYLLVEKVFYGSGENFVISTSNYKDFGKCYLIYDDFVELLDKDPVDTYSFGGIRCLSKEAVKAEHDVTFFIESTIEEMFFKTYKKFPGSHDIVKERIRLYKKQYPNIFTDDNLIIFNAFPKVKGNKENEMQRPKIQDKYRGKKVSKDISAKDLSGSDKFIFDPSEYEKYDRVERGNTSELETLKRGTLRTNINWSIHDLGHTIFEEINNEESEIDYQVYEDFIDSEIYKKIYGKNYYKKNPRNLDKIYELFESIKNISEFDRRINQRKFINLKKLLDNFTPGAGKFDQEFSLFAKMLHDGGKDRVKNIVNEIVLFCNQNKDDISPEIVSYFNLNKTSNLLEDFLYSIFKEQDEISKNFFKYIKIVFASV
jgi:hypothetical protein